MKIKLSALKRIIKEEVSLREQSKQTWFGPVLSDVDVLDGAERLEHLSRNIVLDMKNEKDKNRVRRNTASLFEDMKVVIDECLEFMKKNSW